MAVSAQRSLLVLFLLANTGKAQVALSLASASARPGSTISLDLTLSADKTSIADLQWTLNYVPSDIASLTIAVGPAGASAGKTVWCASAPGTVECLLTGLNQNIIASGVVARVTAHLNQGTLSAISVIGVTDTLGSSLAAEAVPIAAQGSTLMIFQPVSSVSATDVVNTADYLTGPVAPGELVTIFGAGMGPLQGVSMQVDSGTVATTLADARVLFDGVPAPLLFVRSDQIATVTPYGVAGRPSTRVQIEYRGALSGVIAIPVVAASPAIFAQGASGAGQGAILNQNGTVNSASNPATPDSVVTIYATGAGETKPASVDGGITGTKVLPKPVTSVTAWIGGLEADILYAGAAPDEVAGMLQVNARIPKGISTGPAVPVSLAIGAATSQPGVTLAVK
jgi:uncharacterized protein (TIGR03437 family)